MVAFKGQHLILLSVELQAAVQSYPPPPGCAKGFQILWSTLSYQENIKNSGALARGYSGAQLYAL